MAMIIDHVGKVFYPDILILQIIGRLAFPIFGYCLVFGFLHTKNIKGYIIRLMLLAVVSQPLYVMAFDYPLDQLNIFFTLFVALFSLEFLRRKKYLAYCLILAICPLVNIEFGIQGVILVHIIFVFRKARWKAVSALTIYFSLMILIDLQAILNNLYYSNNPIWKPSPSLNIFGWLALPLLYWPIGKQLNQNKIFFYVFYPAHLAILAGLRHLYL